MKKLIYLCLFIFTVISACKKASDEVDFKFTKIEGSKSTAINGILKLEWQDTKNTSWNIILYNLTDGTKKIIPTNTKSITETIIIGNDYKIVNSRPDTLNPCNGNTIKVIRITGMPDLFTIPASCAPFYFTTINARKINSTQASADLSWVASGNTNWDLKVTDITLGSSNTISDLNFSEQTVVFPLGNTQQFEVIGKQNGAKKSFKASVESNGNVVISEFY